MLDANDADDAGSLLQKKGSDARSLPPRNRSKPDRLSSPVARPNSRLKGTTKKEKTGRGQKRGHRGADGKPLQYKKRQNTGAAADIKIKTEGGEQS